MRAPSLARTLNTSCAVSLRKRVAHGLDLVEEILFSFGLCFFFNFGFVLYVGLLFLGFLGRRD